MPSGRNRRDCLASVSEPQWLKTYDRWRKEISSQRIDAHANLYELLITVAAAYIADGWAMDSDITRNFSGFFVVRGDVRLHVHIMPREHALAPHGRS